MGDASAWRFVLFALIFAGVVYFQFFLAHRQWSRLKGGEASEIDVGYVRVENYLAQSFRTKLKDWLQLPAQADPQLGRIILKGEERIRITGALALPAGEVRDEILVVEGDFSCGAGSTLAREVCVRGNASIGTDSLVQALAADGDLLLGDRTAVARWLDSNGELTLGAESNVGARVTSLKRIRLGSGARSSSLYAPEVVSPGWDGQFPNQAEASSGLLEIVFPDASESADPSLKAAGLDSKNFHQLGPDTWLYKGDLRPLVAVRLAKKLVVRGDCHLPDSSVVEADIKVSKSLALGPSCVSKGNLVAGKNIYLARACRFSGLIHAGASLLLSRETRGLREQGPVAVYAHDTLSLENNVAVRGKLAAGGLVTVVDAAGAEDWRRRRHLQEDGSPLTHAKKL